MTGNLSDLIDHIEMSSVPDWLRDYVEVNRNGIIFDLKTTRKHNIIGPDGIIIKIQVGNNTTI